MTLSCSQVKVILVFHNVPISKKQLGHFTKTDPIT